MSEPTRSPVPGSAVPEHLPELQWIVDALDDKRAKDVRVLDLSPLTASLDCFVIATAESQPQIQALEDDVVGVPVRVDALPRGVGDLEADEVDVGVTELDPAVAPAAPDRPAAVHRVGAAPGDDLVARACVCRPLL